MEEEGAEISKGALHAITPSECVKEKITMRNLISSSYSNFFGAKTAFIAIESTSYMETSDLGWETWKR